MVESLLVFAQRRKGEKMGKQSYVYDGCRILRWSKVCFEIEDRLGKRYAFFADRNAYRDDFLVESKDEAKLPQEKKAGFKSLMSYVANKERIGGYDAYELYGWSASYANGDPSFIEGALKDMKEASNPRYVGNYCVALLHEIAKLPKTRMSPYLEALIPYLDKTTSIAGVELEKYVSSIEKVYALTSKTRRSFYLSLGKAGLNFSATPRLQGMIEGELRKAIAEKSDGLEGVLRNFPLVSSAGASADFLYQRYKGLGMKPSFRLLYLINKGHVEELVEALVSNPFDFLSAFQEGDSITPLELFRYLIGHGYEAKKKELAKALIALVSSPRDYFALRPFLSDKDVIEAYADKPRFGDRWGDKSRILPIVLEKEGVGKAINEGQDHYYYTEAIRLSAYAYGYGEGKLKLADYEIKDLRKEVRASLSNGNEDVGYVDCALGLVAAGDSATQRYFLSEFEEDRHGDPCFAFVKAYIGEKLGKKIKDSYPYPEGK